MVAFKSRLIAVSALCLLGLSPLVANAKPAKSQSAKSLSERNRQLVITFYNQFFNKHELSAAERYLAPEYKQHNPFVPTGRKAVMDFFRGNFRTNPQQSARIVRSAVDRDLVYLHVHSKSSPADTGRAVMDIFRVKGNKIVEHWDVVQPVPAKSANNNTMF